jgi:hypothetical protein
MSDDDGDHELDEQGVVEDEREPYVSTERVSRHRVYPGDELDHGRDAYVEEPDDDDVEAAVETFDPGEIDVDFDGETDDTDATDAESEWTEPEPAVGATEAPEGEDGGEAPADGDVDDPTVEIELIEESDPGSEGDRVIVDDDDASEGEFARDEASGTPEGFPGPSELYADELFGDSAGHRGDPESQEFHHSADDHDSHEDDDDTGDRIGDDAHDIHGSDLGHESPANVQLDEPELVELDFDDLDEEPDPESSSGDHTRESAEVSDDPGLDDGLHDAVGASEDPEYPPAHDGLDHDRRPLTEELDMSEPLLAEEEWSMGSATGGSPTGSGLATRVDRTSPGEEDPKSKRRGIFRRQKGETAHDHDYQESRTVGGITRRVCSVCGHVSFAGEDLYEEW